MLKNAKYDISFIYLLLDGNTMSITTKGVGYLALLETIVELYLLLCPLSECRYPGARSGAQVMLHCQEELTGRLFVTPSQRFKVRKEDRLTSSLTNF